MASDNSIRDNHGNQTIIGRSTTVATETAQVRVNPSNGALQAEIAAMTRLALKSGRATVGTTAAQIQSTSTVVNRVTVKALAANTAPIYIGVSGVTTATGFELSAGQSVDLEIANLNQIYAISTVASQAACYIGG